MKFRYIGDSNMVTVGIAGAQFYKGVINEVPDERLAAQLINNPAFEIVTADMLPPVTDAIMHAPVQGALHSDPEVDAFIRDKLKRAKEGKATDHAGTDGLGQIARVDQYAANVEALSGQDSDQAELGRSAVTESSSDGGGEEKLQAPVSGRKLKPKGEG